MYYNMSSQITKLVLVLLKNGNVGWVRARAGDTYTTIEILSSHRNPQEGRGKKQEEEEVETIPIPPHLHSPALRDDGGVYNDPPPLPPPLPSS